MELDDEDKLGDGNDVVIILLPQAILVSLLFNDDDKLNNFVFKWESKHEHFEFDNTCGYKIF